MTAEQTPGGDRKIEIDDPSVEVLVVGAGHVYGEKIKPALSKMASLSKCVLVDPDPAVFTEETDSRTLIGSYKDLEINLPPEFASKVAALILTPDKLEPIATLSKKGITKFIVEKPIASNTKEADLLELLVKEKGLKVEAIDHYLPKIVPLMMLLGKVKPDDPKWDWVEQPDNPSGVLQELCGSLDKMIGPIEGVVVNIVEGGKFGQDLLTRGYLRNDPVKGGMLLDLATHAFTPLLAAGIIDPQNLRINNAQRYIILENRCDLVKADIGRPEDHATVQMSIQLGSMTIPFLLEVGKTFDDGGLWNIVLRGSRGTAHVGLRTGDCTTVCPNEGKPILLKLKKEDPYVRVFENARRTFAGESDGNLGASLQAIRIIDKIKEISGR